MSETQISDAHGEAVDEDKRDFIFIATGAAAAADTLAAGSIEINLAGIAEGQQLKMLWRGAPVFVRHRTAAEIAAAEAVDLDSLPDAQADNDRLIAKPDGTIDPRYLVMVGRISAVSLWVKLVISMAGIAPVMRRITIHLAVFAKAQRRATWLFPTIVIFLIQ